MSLVFCQPETGPILAAYIHSFLRGRAKIFNNFVSSFPPKFYLSIETKIEPDLRLVFW